MYSSAGAATTLVLTVLVSLIVLLVLYFIIRSAVSEGMKNYQRWREATGRDVPPTEPPAPTTRA